MLIKQLSVFIENKPGRLAEVTSFISDAGINIHALSVADTTDFGILRMIVDDPDKARSVMKSAGLTVKPTDVLAAGLEDKPGSLSEVLRELGKCGVSIEYMYAFTSRSSKHHAMVIIRLANQADVLDRVMKSSIRFLEEDDIREL
ncbi:MAG: ACT domain-containing protein [Defluviitaleaceae bacterium]|nr:ACT domain-containing protein [Defluviitaleaceae bacterium]